ncbi:MAG: class I SAM-dependent methyltransferase [bacterium]
MLHAPKSALSVLSSPGAYDAVQTLMGGDKGRRDLACHFIRARPGDNILDVGCGTARILDYLPADVRYWGYDVSDRYVEAARSRYGHRAQLVSHPLTEAELLRLPQFNIVLAIGLLHHLDDAEAGSFIRLARSALGPGGRLITIDPCFEPGQSLLARALISCDRGQYVRRAAAYETLARPFFAAIRGTLRHRRWVPYTHWIMECDA